MPQINQVSSAASTGLGVALPLLTSLSNPASAAIAAGVGLIGLVDKIGQGRKAANKMTGKGGPQDILNKQLAAINASESSAQEKAAATDRAWRGFLKAANEFASANPKQATVVKQAIYNTPTLTTTVQSLLGKNPLDTEYTDIASSGILAGQGRPNPGPSVGGSLLKAGLSAGVPFAIDKLRSIGDVANPTILGSSGLPLPGQETPVPAPGRSPGAGATNVSSGSLLEKLIPNLVSSGTALIGGVVAANAAGKAAEVQAGAAERAAEIQAQAGREAIAFNRDVLAQQQENLQPWLDAGRGALVNIRDIVDSPDYRFTEEFRLPTKEEAMADPGIQFALDRGAEVLEASLRAKGLSMSGKAIKEIQELGQRVAGAGYDNVAQRNLTAYNTRYNTFANERAARLNPEMSIAGIGQTATGQLNADLSTAGGRNMDIGLTTANNVASQATNAAAARASGYVGAGNVMGQTIGQIGSNVLDQMTLDQILKRIPISSVGAA